MATPERKDPPPFSRARAAGGLALLGLVIALGFLDAFLPDFQLDPIETGLLLGTALLLLGVEGARWLIR